MYVCVCKGVSEREVKSWIQKGAKTVKELQEKCSAGAGCGGCVSQLKELLDKTEGAPQNEKRPETQNPLR